LNAEYKNLLYKHTALAEVAEKMANVLKEPIVGVSKTPQELTNKKGE